MTAKQYLMEVHKLRRRISSLELQQEELRTKAEGLKAIVYDKDKVQTSVANRFDTIMTELVTVQEEYARTIAECYAAIAMREKKISALQPRYAEVLMWRYVKQHEKDGRMYYFREIAKKMNYSEVQIKRVHSQALAAFESRWMRRRKRKDDTQ